MVKHKKTFKKSKKSLKSYDKKIKKSFNKNHCSPNKSKNTLSCIDHDILLKIAHIFNKFYNSNIDLNDKKKLYKHISKIISNMSNCKSEYCWTSLNEIIKHLTPDELNRFKNSFKPQMPKSWSKNNNTWLSTSDIEKVLKQYEEHHKDFKCYGALPMDFKLRNGNSCVSGDLCNINLKQHMDNGHNKIGSVFNLDDHDEPGSHWVSMYMELKPCCREKPSIYYFDSIADKPTKEIRELVDYLSEQYKSLTGGEMEFLYNDIQHQKRNTECGIYSIHFITSMLENKNFEDYIKNVKNDDYMNKYRDFYYIR
jgi:hypothetical protein